MAIEFDQSAAFCVDSIGVVALRWEGNALSLLDQRGLPQREDWLRLLTADAVFDAIRDMVVRGAPAIGIAAAYGAVLAAQAVVDKRDWRERIEQAITHLSASRPTAVNLFWALAQMRAGLAQSASAAEAVALLTQKAEQIHADDLAANLKMGDLALSVMTETQAFAVLTHCNTGALATGGYGTALGVIRSLWRAGRLTKVYADETRPWLQGARLTAWELAREGIPVVLNVDAAAAHILRQGEVRWVIVGADRITANGDVANKIGTYGLAVLARHHGVKFMVVAPGSTVDMQLASGTDIVIEERTADELKRMGGQLIAPAAVAAFNPVFDVTPADLIDVIVTEKGVVHAPDREAMQALFGRASE